MIFMGYVDAIEDGKIVHVTEEYAKEEGLFILRREIETNVPEKKEARFISRNPEPMRKTRLDLDPYRKPLKFGEERIEKSLAEHFHWEIARMRKVRGLSRDQVAASLGVSKEDIKMVENGVLPSQDFILISKIEKFFGISLRKDGKDFVNSPIKGTMTNSNEKKVEAKQDNNDIDIQMIGDDIEIKE